jgi:hypothetical protein
MAGLQKSRSWASGLIGSALENAASPDPEFRWARPSKPGPAQSRLEVGGDVALDVDIADAVWPHPGAEERQTEAP